MIMKTALLALASLIAGGDAFAPPPGAPATVALRADAGMDLDEDIGATAAMIMNEGTDAVENAPWAGSFDDDTSAAAAATESTSVAQAAPVAMLDFSKDIGAQAPLGFFDPLKLVEGRDQANFDKWRNYELTHGRVCMLATAGWLSTANGLRLPGMEKAPFGFKALFMTGMPMEARGTVPLAFFTIFFLTLYVRDETGEAQFPGDFRNGYIDFGWDGKDAAWQEDQRRKELANGRLAMIGIAGIMAHELLGNLEDLNLPQP